MANRDPKLDVLKGILICLVVVGHFLEPLASADAGDLYPGWHAEPQRWVLLAIYSFHMPAFVLLAGVTASPSSWRRRARQMLTLYVVLQVLYGIPRIAVGGSALGLLVSPGYGLWFLLAMVGWSLTAPAIRRAPRTVLVVSILAAVVTVLLPWDGGVLTWSRAVYFWPFFVIGHLAGRAIVDRTRGRGAPERALALIGLVGVLVGVVVAGLSPAWVRGAQTVDGLDVDPAVAVAGRAAGLGLGVLCCVLLFVISPASSRWLEQLGQRSLGIYSLHLAAIPVLGVVVSVIDGVGDSTWTILALIVSVLSLAVLGGVRQFDDIVRRTAALGSRERSVANSRPTPSEPPAPTAPTAQHP